MTPELCYIVNAAGNRTHIVLPVAEYEELLAQKNIGQLKSIDQADSSRARPVGIPGLEAATAEEVFVYSLPRKGGFAKALWRFPMMVVLKGSTIAEPENRSMPEPYRCLRQWLIECEIISRISGELTFTQDYSFNNPSEAVCVVEGGSRDGYRSWVDRKGKTIHDLGFSR